MVYVSGYGIYLCIAISILVPDNHLCAAGRFSISKYGKDIASRYQSGPVKGEIMLP